MIFCTGLALPEGPALLDDGSWLFTELALERGCVTHVDATGATKRVVARTGRPNGIAVDRAGTIWVAESLDPSIVRLGLDGEAETWASSCEGEPLLWPNDLCLGPDEALYVTDSGIRVTDFLDGDRPRADHASLQLDGRVCRFELSGGEGRMIDRGLQFANGIAFGPDEALYVNETMTGNVYRYEPASGWRRELFGNVLDPDFDSRGLRGPDGMKFDADGRLYVTVFGQGDITVLDSSGRVIERIPTVGNAPTNVAFGPAGSRAIYVVEDEYGQVEVHDARADGLALHR